MLHRAQSYTLMEYGFELREFVAQSQEFTMEEFAATRVSILSRTSEIKATYDI